ncbi:MAG: hypothetical protein JNK60_05545, partial [Acidobacteria bacterium]|nr:hypothetical protein [Acidobacteriota bacterium]
NLGLVHGAFEGSALELEIQVFDGETGAAAGNVERVTLAPGEFRQLNRVLTLGGPSVANGYVRVRRISGTAPTVVYGVVNDGAASGGGTSDGSFVPSGGVTTEGLVPIVLDVPAASRFRTELVLANPTAEARLVSLRYASAPAFGVRTSGTATTTLAPGRQLVIADAIAFLRSNGVPIPSGAAVGGTLAVSGASALARTFNPNPDATVGGTFGVAYPAVPAEQRARRSALVFGLRHDESVRSNLALADARAETATREYVIDVYDGDHASEAPAFTLRRSLQGGDWIQIDAILRAGPEPLRTGWARVRVEGTASTFVTYGVVNDGPEPGKGTSDGSYLPMNVED